jgi:hypothetical protein
MKVKNLFFFLMLCLVLIISISNCHAQPPTSLDLINNARVYDNKTISYKGEAIGDIMIRGDHAWLHVNDGIIAIGIWASKTLIEDISYVGDYQKKGDIVEVSGVFHRACPEHGGDLDIHASEIKKVTSGAPVIQPISGKKVYIGIVSLMLILLFYGLNKFFLSNL